MIVYTEKDLQVLLDLTSHLMMDKGDTMREVYYKTGGTFQDPVFFHGENVLKFLAAKFEDIPLYLGSKFETLIRWRLMIGR